MNDIKNDITIENVIDSIHKKNESNNNQPVNNDNIEQLVKLELGKIIVEKSLDIKNIQSLTFLYDEHIDDILNAKILNTYFKVDEIDDYISDFMQLKRSEDGKLLKLYSQMAMFVKNDEGDIFNKRGFFDKILKR